MTPKQNEQIAEQLQQMGYHILQVLGTGAFATVYLVQNAVTGETLACKVSPYTEMAQREAEMLQQVKHPLFPQYKDYALQGQNSFLFQEAVEGQNLRQYMEQNGRLTQRQVLSIAYEVSDGLQYLHEKSCPIVFLDVKPDHILLQPEGKVRMVDFGSAVYCHKAAGVHTGTAGYSAWEQLTRTAEPGMASDVYGLAATMWYLRTGTLPETAAWVTGTMPGTSVGVCGTVAGTCTRLKGTLFRPTVHRFLEQCLQDRMANRIPSMCYMHYKIGTFLQNDRKGLLHIMNSAIRNGLPGRHVNPRNMWIFDQNIGKMPGMRL